MFTMRTVKDKSKHLNDLTYTDYYYRLMLLARSVFKWNNLPNGIDEQWIERYLFFEGSCIFFHHDELGFMVSKSADGGQLNHYDEPTTLVPVFNNYQVSNIKPLTNNVNAVLIKNNDVMVPTAPTIELFARRIADLQRSIDININAMKTPVLIKCTDKQKISLKHTFNQWNGFEPVIYGDKNLDTDSMSALNLSAPVVFDKLQIQKNATMHECLTFLGINNANTDKRERLVDDEVQANNQQIALSASVMLKSRENAVNLINQMFGLNISVELRNDLSFDMNEHELKPSGGDTDNG